MDALVDRVDPRCAEQELTKHRQREVVDS